MNNARRKQLKDLANRISIMNDIQDTSHLQEYYSILEDIKNDEEEYFDNMPENLQGSMRGMDSEEAISNMDDALEVLEQAIDENDQDITVHPSVFLVCLVTNRHGFRFFVQCLLHRLRAFLRHLWMQHEPV